MHPAVTAVLLGAGGIAIVAGAGIAEAAETTATRPTETPIRLSHTELGSILGTTNTAPAAPVSMLSIGSSVGFGGKNVKADVEAVQQRLADLGFDIKVDGKYGAGTLKTIRIFESMMNGNENIAESRGLILPNGELHKALASQNAPKWVQMPDSGVGFVREDWDGYGWGSSVTRDVIVDVGKSYEANWRSLHPGSPPIAVNDVSKKAGGAVRDHESHEAGLDIDVRLPRKDGSSGAKVGWTSYDRNTAEAMVRSFATDARVERVIIGDWTMYKKILDSNVSWKSKIVVMSDHKDHIHVDVAGANNPNVNAPRLAE